MFAAELRIQGKVTPGDGVSWAYLGITVGDFLTGTLSQLLHSRKKVVPWVWWSAQVSWRPSFRRRGSARQRFMRSSSDWESGWAIGQCLATIAAEQFGTNLRATVATTVPNFVRGALIPITWLYLGLQGPHTSPLRAAATTGVIVVVIAFAALLGLRETYGVDLDYVELPEGSHFNKA